MSIGAPPRLCSEVYCLKGSCSTIELVGQKEVMVLPLATIKPRKLLVRISRLELASAPYKEAALTNCAIPAFYKYYIIIYNIYQDFNLSKLAEIIVSKTNRVEVLDILSLGMAGFEPAELRGQSPMRCHFATSHSL